MLISGNIHFSHTMRASAEINAEIYNIGPALFEAVRSAVVEFATVGDSQVQKVINQARLKAAVEEVIAEAAPATLDHRGMWQVLWPRVVYAGTLASKATAEIASMRGLVPLFKDFAVYLPEHYVFDKSEWDAFAKPWKERYAGARANQWLALSKRDADWNPAAYFSHTKTTSEVWTLLIKDEYAFPSLRFSANAAKVAKYLKLARFLYDHRAAGKQQPLDYYLDGIRLSEQHLTGQSWLQERRGLAAMRHRLAEQLGGDITALHTMMDLGLKTIKPDRVMTYLFSQLGWLQTLPSTMSKCEVVSVYVNDAAVDEMTIRADVLAAALDNAGHQQAHRLLDIWFVKYGQEPEPNFGITVNLQAAGPGIRSILETTAPRLSEGISAFEADAKWPCREFQPITRTAVAKKDVHPAQKISRPRVPFLGQAEAEKLFMDEWKQGRRIDPPIYQARIENKLKDEILKKIRRRTHPAVAFRSVLLTTTT